MSDIVQTEVVGQDGISYAPIRNQRQLQAIREQIAGWNGNPTDEECRTTLKGVGLFEWQTVGEYLDCLERNRTATNVAMLVPQGNLRLLACGPYDTPATPDEIQDQVKLLREAMDQGAVGMSRWVMSTLVIGLYLGDSKHFLTSSQWPDIYAWDVRIHIRARRPLQSPCLRVPRCILRPSSPELWIPGDRELCRDAGISPDHRMSRS